jgi:hypothetical protein
MTKNRSTRKRRRKIRKIPKRSANAARNESTHRPRVILKMIQTAHRRLTLTARKMKATTKVKIQFALR